MLAYPPRWWRTDKDVAMLPSMLSNLRWMTISTQQRDRTVGVGHIEHFLDSIDGNIDCYIDNCKVQTISIHIICLMREKLTMYFHNF